MAATALRPDGAGEDAPECGGLRSWMTRLGAWGSGGAHQPTAAPTINPQRGRGEKRRHTEARGRNRARGRRRAEARREISAKICGSTGAPENSQWQRGA